MNRRAFLAATAGSLLAAPLAADAQEPAKVHQIGYLSYGSPAEAANRVRALRIGLRDRGYVEGKSINLVFRWAETAERLPELAADLVRLKVDLIFAPTSTEVDAARRATKTIPIVFAGHADPVGVGHVASLARPGGNITGLSVLLTEIVAKQLEIMKQALPHMKRIGVLLTVTAPSHRPALHAVEATAQRLGVQVLTVPVQTPEDLDGAFAMMVRERVNGFLALATPLIRAQRAVLAELSLKHRLAGMFGFFAGPEQARVCRSRNVLVGQRAASALTTAAQGGCPTRACSRQRKKRAAADTHPVGQTCGDTGEHPELTCMVVCFDQFSRKGLS